jgi:hypothetical protein
VFRGQAQVLHGRKKKLFYLAFLIVASVCGFCIGVGHGIFLLDFFEMCQRENTTEHHEKVHLSHIEMGA